MNNVQQSHGRNPLTRPHRPVAACSRCRGAKIKCDGKLPACTSCEKNGRAAECTSTNDQFARGKERSYVSTLETRIDKLEAKIREAQLRKPSVVSIPDNETPVPSRRPSEQIYQSQRQPPQDEVPTPTTGRKLRRREVSAIDDLVSDFGFLSVNATARDFHGFTQAMSYARLILWCCSKDELPKGTSKALPPRIEGIALVRFYLNNIFALLPAFDEAWLWTAVENVYAKGSRMFTAQDHWMVRMVFAISNASMSRRSGDEHYLESISHVCAALDYSEHVLHPGNISGVQALLLLAEYAMLAPHHFDSWQLIGAASRAMSDLGYHQDPPRGSPMDRSKLELRRRVFYCIYVLDRSTSLVQTRAFSFSDASANVKVPFSKQPRNTSIPTETGSSPPPQQWMQSYEQALDLIELRKIQSDWYTDLFQTSREVWEDPYPELWRMCESMKKWFDNLSTQTPQHMRQFFELDLLYSYVYVLSPSSRVPRIHQFAQKLIFEYCIHYTDLMLHLINDPAYTAPVTFYDAMRVYMTGRQFIDVLSHSIDLLLSGAVPPHPEVKPSSAPPPAVPVVPLPPGKTLQRFNTYRAINCIKQTMDCMGHFGVRWGYIRYYSTLQNILHTLTIATVGTSATSTNPRPCLIVSSSVYTYLMKRTGQDEPACGVRTDLFLVVMGPQDTTRRRRRWHKAQQCISSRHRRCLRNSQVTAMLPWCSRLALRCTINNLRCSPDSSTRCSQDLLSRRCNHSISSLHRQHRRQVSAIQDIAHLRSLRPASNLQLGVDMVSRPDRIPWTKKMQYLQIPIRGSVPRPEC